MHEYYITEEIIRIAGETAAQHQAPSIRKITIVVGELAGAVPDSIRFYFDSLAQNTAAAGAELAVIWQPVVRCCPACGLEFAGSQIWQCPDCGAAGKVIRDGREFYVEAIHLPD